MKMAGELRRVWILGIMFKNQVIRFDELGTGWGSLGGHMERRLSMSYIHINAWGPLWYETWDGMIENAEWIEMRPPTVEEEKDRRGRDIRAVEDLINEMIHGESEVEHGGVQRERGATSWGSTWGADTIFKDKCPLRAEIYERIESILRWRETRGGHLRDLEKGRWGLDTLEKAGRDLLVWYCRVVRACWSLRMCRTTDGTMRPPNLAA